MTTSEELLGRVALGDRSAFRQLYQQTSAHLFPVALRILRTRELAEDALQDAFIQVWNNAKEFRPGSGSAGAWMSTIVRYRALDKLRRKPREQNLDESWDPADASDPIGRLLDNTDLQVCFEELSDEQRRVVALAYIDGLSHSEMAERLETPLGTVKSWVRRGLKVLKECLSR